MSFQGIEKVIILAVLIIAIVGIFVMVKRK